MSARSVSFRPPPPLPRQRPGDQFGRLRRWELRDVVDMPATPLPRHGRGFLFFYFLMTEPARHLAALPERLISYRPIQQHRMRRRGVEDERPGYDRGVLANFVDVAGRLIAIPVQHKKRLAVLRWLRPSAHPLVRIGVS